MSPAIGLCCMCSIGVPPTKNFRLGHCFGPASLLDLLHNPKCTRSSLSLNSPIYLLVRKRRAHHFFILRTTKQIHAFSEVVPKGRLAEIPVFRPLSLAHMWLTRTLVVVLIYD